MRNRTLLLAVIASALLATLVVAVPTVAQASATTVAASQSGTSIRLASDAATDPTVTFNTQSKKYHCPTCRYAKQCTKNCIEIKKSEAVAKGGVVCKICGGTCK